MKVFSQKYPGSIIICPECDWLLGYNPSKDVYENKYIYCPNPQCRAKIEVPIDLSYDGLKKEPTT